MARDLEVGGGGTFPEDGLRNVRIATVLEQIRAASSQHYLWTGPTGPASSSANHETCSENNFHVMFHSQGVNQLWL
jgi:hypothetical protein